MIMITEQVLENNILIHKFKIKDEIGELAVFENDLQKAGTAECLQYHESWDWLMPVVEKCTQIGFREQEFDNEIYQKWEEVFDDTGMFLGNHIDEVFEACTLFIEWYNENLEL